MGRVLVTDHTMLNEVVENLARQFGVDLPDEPSSKQKQWMDEISAASGEEYNRILTDRLCAAHGSVFSLIAEIRAGTRNDTIRDFAQTANDIVLKHMTLIEGTGYVTMDGMFAEAPARTTDNAENQPDGGDIALAGIGATLG